MNISYREIYDELNNIQDGIMSYAPTDQLQALGKLRLKIAEVLKYQESLVTNYKEYPVLCLDFDGVIHSYKSGWKGIDVIPDAPLPGAFRFIEKAVKTWQVQIFSARCNTQDGIYAMKRWFLDHGLHVNVLARLSFRPGKPSWFLHIDDRAIKFNGDWCKLDPIQLKLFRPWYYGEDGWQR